MASFTNYDSSLKTCPYNKLHKVRVGRFQKHMVECARSGMYPALAECPYNATHRIKPDELHRHLVLCRDNRQVIQTMLTNEDSSREWDSQHQSEIRRVLNEEDWDDPKQLKDSGNLVTGAMSRNESEQETDDLSGSSPKATAVEAVPEINIKREKPQKSSQIEVRRPFTKPLFGFNDFSKRIITRTVYFFPKETIKITTEVKKENQN